MAITNYAIVDTIDIKQIKFHINPKEAVWNREQTLNVEVSYPRQGQVSFNLIYTPSRFHRLKKSLLFFNEKGKWIIVDQSSIVKDGKFD